MVSNGLLHIDTPVLANQQKLTSSVLCRHWIPPRGLTKNNDQCLIGTDGERKSRESALLSCLMMMIMMMPNIFNF